MISMFTSDSQHPPRSKHAVHLGGIKHRFSKPLMPNNSHNFCFPLLCNYCHKQTQQIKTKNGLKMMLG